MLGLAVLSTNAAVADVWKWVDPLGNTHFVETMKPIYTWLDDANKVHFSDSPDHEDAIRVQLVWHSGGTLDDLDADPPADENDAHAVSYETAEEREARRKAEELYCRRVTEIYESYLNAPRMYRSDADGERVYLSEREARQAIAEIDAARSEACR